ncbi:hypothetical protein J6590_012644 [Homalodisca vitripennis]|nr:hypothetical protein J6590_012644 [Homalodisca vitripennis]
MCVDPPGRDRHVSDTMLNKGRTSSSACLSSVSPVPPGRDRHVSDTMLNKDRTSSSASSERSVMPFVTCYNDGKWPKACYPFKNFITNNKL